MVGACLSFNRSAGVTRRTIRGNRPGMRSRTGVTARRAVRSGAMLLLAAASVATPGLARDSGPSRLGTVSAPSFSDTFASYAATPQAHVAPGAVDVTSLPAPADAAAAG